MSDQEYDDEIKLGWIAPEFKKHDHTIEWYAGLFLFGSILVAWGLYTNNLISVILFALIVFVLYALSHREPRQLRVELTEEGVIHGNNFHPYEKLRHFWVIHNWESQQLILETTSWFRRHLFIELDDQDPHEVHHFLDHFLPEGHEYEESFIDYLTRRLKI